MLLFLRKGRSKDVWADEIINVFNKRTCVLLFLEAPLPIFIRSRGRGTLQIPNHLLPGTAGLCPLFMKTWVTLGDVQASGSLPVYPSTGAGVLN